MESLGIHTSIYSTIPSTTQMATNLLELSEFLKYFPSILVDCHLNQPILPGVNMIWCY